MDHPADDGTDIGVGRLAEPPVRDRDVDDRRIETGRRLVGIVAVVVAVGALVALVVGGSDEAADDPEEPPAATTPGNDDRSSDANPTGPDDIDSEEAIEGPRRRAGEVCTTGDVRWVVPDGFATTDCARLEAAGAAGTGSELPAMTVERLPHTLAMVLSARFGDDRHRFGVGTWNPVDQARGWRFDWPRSSVDRITRASRLQLVEVGQETLVVSDFVDADDRWLRAGFAQLIESIELPTKPAPLPAPGGWCGDDHFLAPIPEGWFAHPSCRGFNTSSESARALQCECLPPLWIERRRIPLDGDHGIVNPTDDRLVTRRDGSVVRVIEGLQLDGDNQERPVRAIIVDGGDTRIAVMATQFPQHALPGHTWGETLVAQREVADGLVFLDTDDCDGPEARASVITPAGADLTIGTGTVALPPGTAVLTTGCGDRDHTQVRVEADPILVGDIATSALGDPPIVAACPGGPLDRDDWKPTLRGDFDGDGRLDSVLTRSTQTDASTGRVSDVAVALAAGGVAEGRVQPFSSRVDLSRGRLLGVGRDHLRVQFTEPDEGLALLLVEDCSLVQVVGERGDPQSIRWCESRPGPFGQIRVWTRADASSTTDEASSQIWAGRNRAIISTELHVDEEPPCGPTVEQQPPAGDDEWDRAWRGTHAFASSMVTDEEAGTITFEPTGDGWTLSGRHGSGEGPALMVEGTAVAASATEIWFDGRLVSSDGENDPDPCVRRGRQRFVDRDGSGVFRLDDTRSCAGTTIEAVTITIDPRAE